MYHFDPTKEPIHTYFERQPSPRNGRSNVMAAMTI